MTDLTGLTDDEVGTVASALWDYRIETERYLSGYDYGKLFPDHDDCCQTARARWALRDREKVALQERLDLINGVLARVDPSSVPPIGSAGPAAPEIPGID